VLDLYGISRSTRARILGGRFHRRTPAPDVR
jgi:hypothetical protein